MARIRSIHPGQTTDEDFVECGPWARLLAIHIRCEADDHGVFPWRPKTIKMRVFPADNIKVEKLLAELETYNQIKSIEVNGKRYGVIRNFGKWQSPKKPTYQHPTTPEILAYAGFADAECAELHTDLISASSEFCASSELHPPSADISSEFSRQREEEEEEEEENKLTLPLAPPAGWQEREDVQFDSIPMDGNKQEHFPDEPPAEPTSSASSVSPPETLPALLDLTPTTADPVQQAFDRYNHAAETAGLPVAQKLTPGRRSKIKARLKECGGLDGWDAALEKLAASDFCTGVKTGWKADLDFLIQESSFIKLMEGSYDNHTSPNKPRSAAESLCAGADMLMAVFNRRDAMGAPYPDPGAEGDINIYPPGF